jgi:death-on-curing protein
MEEPTWVMLEAVTALHRRLLAEHGGLPGVRDQGGLEAAHARPQHLWAYGDPAPDLAALAACYAGGFVRNHPFVDGNKRVGLAVALAFLRLNEWNAAVSQVDAYINTLKLAAREMSDEEYAAWLRANLVPWRP